MAGGIDFNRSKFEELIVYIASRLGPADALGRVKLAKLLMHSDFTAFLRLGRSMTGATYEKWEHGHLPKELLLTQRDLEASGAIEEDAVDYYGRRLRQLRSLRDPDMSAFSEDEIGIIESSINRYGHESATALSQLAHEEPGWFLSEYRSAIPYESALISTELPTTAETDYFRRLHGVAL